MQSVSRIVLFAINNPIWESVVEATLTASKVDFVKAKESYKGCLEDSYIAVVNDDAKLDLVRDIAKHYNQESILVVDEDRKARLEYIESGDKQSIGQWVEITALDAASHDAWTLVNTRYFACL